MKTSVIINSIFWLTFLAFGSACSGANSSATTSDTVDIGDEETGSNIAATTITVGALSDDAEVTLSIPLAAFGGDESNLHQTTIDVRVNDEYLVIGVNPAVYFYNQESQAVEMLLSSTTIESAALVRGIPAFSSSAVFENGATLTITINDTDAVESNSYTATLSNSDQEISSVVTTGTAFVSLVTSTLCNRVASCAELDLGINQSINCTEEIANTNQLNYEFSDHYGEGDTTDTLSLTDMSDLIDDGTYSVDATALTSCLEWLSALPCLAADAQELFPDVEDPASIEIGYDDSDPMNFDNIENIISADGSECTRVVVTE